MESDCHFAWSKIVNISISKSISSPCPIERKKKGGRVWIFELRKRYFYKFKILVAERKKDRILFPLVISVHPSTHSLSTKGAKRGGSVGKRKGRERISGDSRSVRCEGTVEGSSAWRSRRRYFWFCHPPRALYHTLVTCTFAPWRVSRDKEIWAGPRENGVIIYEGGKKEGVNQNGASPLSLSMFSREGEKHELVICRREASRISILWGIVVIRSSIDHLHFPLFGKSFSKIGGL